MKRQTNRRPTKNPQSSGPPPASLQTSWVDNLTISRMCPVSPTVPLTPEAATGSGVG